MSAPLPILYLDSSVIISYQRGPSDHAYVSAKRIFEEEIGGKKAIGLVSLLALMEIVDVIRKRVTERTNKQTLNSMDDQTRAFYIKSESDKQIKILINALTSMEKQGFINFADFTPLDLKKIMDNVYNYSKNYFGEVRKFNQCSFCRRPYENFGYKGLGWIDLMHSFLAVGLCADKIITADKSFSNLRLDTKFSSLKIVII